jgi:hypothetical protein
MENFSVRNFSVRALWSDRDGNIGSTEAHHINSSINSPCGNNPADVNSGVPIPI